MIIIYGKIKNVPNHQSDGDFGPLVMTYVAIEAMAIEIYIVSLPTQIMVGFFCPLVICYVAIEAMAQSKLSEFTH